MSQQGSTEVEALRLAVADTARRLWWIPLVTGIAWTLASLIVLRFDATSAAGVGILAGIVFLVAGLQDLVMAFALRGPWRWLLLGLGVVLVAAGIYSFVNPVDTFVALASLVGWVLLIKGVFDVTLALTNREADLWWLRLVIGLVELVLALVVSSSFTDKAVFLIAFVGAAALVRGVTDIVMAFQLRALGQGPVR